MTHQDIVNWMAPIVQQYIDTPAP
ncbi:TetR family transcriptional regulator, partial [Mycobacteroides abscessus]|nr:TetR family transcriptional regulator [Mycobacteroides abscessus]MDM2064518.1 TetR family transcriptional regulator [Mycobacteroides abscessus]